MPVPHRPRPWTSSCKQQEATEELKAERSMLSFCRGHSSNTEKRVGAGNRLSVCSPAGRLLIAWTRMAKDEESEYL